MPVRHIEILVSKPGISIVGGAAPLGLRDMIVEKDIDTLIIALFRHGIEHLHIPVSARYVPN